MACRCRVSNTDTSCTNSVGKNMLILLLIGLLKINVNLSRLTQLLRITLEYSQNF